MEALTTYQQGGLPATMEDLARFLLIAPEKAAALGAEIRAIQKVGLAKAVYDQKLEEQRRLCDLILDASVRLGEMTQAIPKGSGGDRKSEDFKRDSVDPFEKIKRVSADPFENAPKTKEETINELGFSKKQVQRFETLADNKDLVDQEKELAREEGRMPTRSNVLEMAKERERRLNEEKQKLAEDNQAVKRFNTATLEISLMPEAEKVLSALKRQYKEVWTLNSVLSNLRGCISKLNDIERVLAGELKERGYAAD